jgi:4,5-DOPA dioxygenase extradiol
VVGSGNIVHNLRRFTWDPASPAQGWAEAFDGVCRSLLDAGDHAPLVDYARLPDAALAAPTPDHYLPLLYAAGAGGADPVSYPVTGFDGGSMSMRSVRFG